MWSAQHTELLSPVLEINDPSSFIILFNSANLWPSNKSFFWLSWFELDFCSFRIHCKNQWACMQCINFHSFIITLLEQQGCLVKETPIHQNQQTFRRPDTSCCPHEAALQRGHHSYFHDCQKRGTEYLPRWFRMGTIPYLGMGRLCKKWKQKSKEGAGQASGARSGGSVPCVNVTMEENADREGGCSQHAAGACLAWGQKSIFLI